jgi:hypothetical protein
MALFITNNIKNFMEFIFEIGDRKVTARSLEIGKDYGVFTIFLEMPEVQHTGYVMKKGEKTLAKGEVARKIREIGIEGLEMASAAPHDTNAIVLIRLSGTKFEERLKKISEIIYEALREEGLI